MYRTTEMRCVTHNESYHHVRVRADATEPRMGIRVACYVCRDGFGGDAGWLGFRYVRRHYQMGEQQQRRGLPRRDEVARHHARSTAAPRSQIWFAATYRKGRRVHLPRGPAGVREAASRDPTQVLGAFGNKACGWRQATTDGADKSSTQSLKLLTTQLSRQSNSKIISELTTPNYV
jgi:hypothetical protein